MEIRKTVILITLLVASVSAHSSIKDFLFPPAHLRYQADVPPISVYNKSTEVRLTARFASAPYWHLQNDIYIPMDYQIKLSIRGLKISKVIIDSMLICDKDTVEVYTVRDLALSPLKPGSTKYVFGTRTRDIGQAYPVLYYHTGTQDILGVNSIRIPKPVLVPIPDTTT